MNILLLGSGGREHALAWKIAASPLVERLYCAPGNAGIAQEAELVDLDISDHAAVVAFCRANQVDFVVVGPEGPLCAGVVDDLEAAGIKTFGPSKAAARLEGSKGFTKDICRDYNIPTAAYERFSDIAAAKNYVRRQGAPIVIKADGLAAGKGVVVADSREDAERAVTAAIVDRVFGEAGAAVVLEERLDGPEVSFFVIADGEHAVPLVAAQDHKRIFDGDRGPNTGGMGAFAPSPLVDAALADRILRDIVRPVLGGLVAEGTPYRGVLYCGLMLTADGPKVIEFNVRFGDPEAQVVLPMIAEPLSALLWAAATGELRSRTVRVRPEAHVGIVLAAHGYPGEVRVGDRIEGLDRLSAECPDALVFFAGVREKDDVLVTSGGRVMTVVGKGPTFDAAIARAYDAVSRVSFAGMQYRRDIGRKALV